MAALSLHAFAQAHANQVVKGVPLAAAQVSNSAQADRLPSTNAACPGRSDCVAVPPAAVEERRLDRPPRIGPSARNGLLLLTAFWLFCGIAPWIGSRDAVVAMALVGGPALVLGLGSASSRASGVVMPGANLSWAMGLVAATVLLVGDRAIVARGMAWLYEGLFGEPGWVRRGYRRWREPRG